MVDYLVFGELSLDGSILPVNGVLPAAIGQVAEIKASSVQNIMDLKLLGQVMRE